MLQPIPITEDDVDLTLDDITLENSDFDEKTGARIVPTQQMQDEFEQNCADLGIF